jgi:chromosome segregation ATPase
MHNRNQCDVDEVASLKGAIESKDLLLQERQTAFDDLERRFNLALNGMRAQLNEKQTLLDQSQSEIQQLKAEMAQILEQRTRLETLQKQTERLLSAQAEQIRAGVRAEIEASESQLSEKESELQSCHGCAREAELCHAAELMELRLRFAETQLLSETRNLQIADLKAENVRLSQQIAQRESIESQTEFHLDSELGRVREFQNRAVSMEGARAEMLGNKGAAEIFEQQETNSQRETQGEIKALRQDLEEKHFLLASRNEELMRVKSDMDVLRDRVSELESSTKRVKESAETESAKMRTDFQAQLAFLQAELSQKEWALEEGQAALKALEQGFRTKIVGLEMELTQRKSSFEHPPQDFILGDSWETESRLERTWKLQERLDANCVESAQPTSNHPSRRWRNSGDWKRRWRSR